MLDNQKVRLLLEPSPFFGSYPKHCDTDEQKMDFLVELKTTRQLNTFIFWELIQLLDIPKNQKRVSIEELLNAGEQI
jgi:hypothetical protein